MTAPHTHSHTPSPPEAPPRPPPVEPDEQPGPSRARWIAAIVILVVAGGLVGWTLLGGDGGTVPRWRAGSSPWRSAGSLS